MTNYIKNDQLEYIKNNMEDILSEIDSTEETFDEDYKAYKEKYNVQNEHSLIQNKDEFRQNLKDTRKEILDNAYLMPYEMRETIRKYLETTAKEYKVKGLFNKEKKKEAIQNEKLDLVKEQLDLKIHDEITKVWIKSLENLNKYINDSNLFEKIINQKYTISKEALAEHVQEQPNITNDYVLIYTKGITDIITRQIRNETNSIIEEIVQNSEVKVNSNENTDQLSLYEEYIEYNELLTSLVTNNFQHYYIHLDESIDKLIDRTYVKIEDLNINNNEAKVKKTSENIIEHKESNMALLKEKVQTLSDLPIYQSEVTNIKNQIERMDENITKIAVFGTFSAGKSSLINAILKRPILLSSPNPTTASITEISYGNTQEVLFKTYDQLLEEINHITEFANQSYESIESFIKDKNIKSHPSLSSNHLAFLRR